MPRITADRLTDAQVARLQPRAARYEVKDGGEVGLAVVVYPTGRKSWIYRYGPKQERRFKLGDADAMTVEKARRKAKAASVKISDGGDPATERRQQRLEKAAAKERENAIEAGDLVPGTVAELAHRYLRTARRRMKPRSFAEVERHVAHVVATWGSRELSSIRRRDVIELAEARRDEAASAGRHEDENRRGIVPAARLLSTLGGLLAFAVTRDELPANPAHGIARKDLGLEETPRDRVLSESELRELWKALNALPLVYAAAFRAIVLTAMRPGEVLALRWDAIQRDVHGAFALLSESKEGSGRRVPLSPQAVEILEQVRALNYDSPYVFPSGARAGHIENPKNVTARILSASGLKRFTPHDLRRTARTLLGSLGVRHEVAERLLGHAVGSAISRVYDRHGYDAEQQEAANRLGERVAEITKEG